ncbi:hypothetical protein DFH07DRAFT_938446 [Mycena maculata]|uniref:Uncharacterized protein n=1 Tax=Mycena maculata TaxID=230809 RepID=A0AAD7JMK2_9AGAR|nr:hypothetical protein DFH07DRAFT_938446 [Mycena maculata]
MRTHSESAADDQDSYAEVIEALQRTSRSSSAIPSSDADLVAESDSEEPDVSFVSASSQDESDDHDLVESDTVWHDDEESLDNDSWVWGGGGNRGAAVTFAPGEKPLACLRIRFTCKGIEACDRLDPLLREAVRFELDSAPRNTIIAAQQETRRREGNTAEERVVLFLKIMRDAKCHAVDSKGNKCRGGPILKPKPKIFMSNIAIFGTSRSHQYFVGCSGWTRDFQRGHRIHSIPDNVDENILANALAGRPLADDKTKDTPACTHAHIVNGMHVRGQIQNYACPAVRYIYIAKDSSIRKVSFGLKDTYRQCVEGNGVLGAMVSKVDNAPSIKQLLKGKTPAAYAPALHNQRVKQDILHAKKIEKYPNGLGVDAILPIYYAELTKPPPERYIHSYVKTEKGELIVVTFVPYLLKLLDDPGVTSFDGDTTFKGIKGNLNEWELTIFAKVVQRAVSILRAYVNGARTDFFEFLFDELQRVKLMATGKPIPLKRFIIGLCRAVMKYNNPEYSGIPKDTRPEDIAGKFIKICWRHSKEPVHDFRSLVSAQDFDRLMDFPYIDSVEALRKFSAFVFGLKIPQIMDWWKNKDMHDYIIPCLVKSQSRPPAEVWDYTPSTTNTNEAQHHWTNSLMGIKLTPVEALESRRKVDQTVAEQIKMSLETGILSNNNELSHRIARNPQCQSAVARKAHESREAADIPKQLQLQIDAEAEKRRASSLLTKSLREQLKAAKGTSGGRGRGKTASLSASSSGRAKTPRGRAVAPSLSAVAQSDEVSTIATTSNTETQSEPTTSKSHSHSAPPVLENSVLDFLENFDFNSLSGGSNSGFNSNSVSGVNGFTFNSLMDGGEDANSGRQLKIPFLDRPAVRFGHGWGQLRFDTLIPAAPAAPAADPVQAFIDLYGIPDRFSNFGGSGFNSAPSFDPSPLPLLPPPPSTPAPSPVVEASRAAIDKKLIKQISSTQRAPELRLSANVLPKKKSQAGTRRDVPDIEMAVLLVFLWRLQNYRKIRVMERCGEDRGPCKWSYLVHLLIAGLRLIVPQKPRHQCAMLSHSAAAS